MLEMYLVGTIQILQIRIITPITKNQMREILIPYLISRNIERRPHISFDKVNVLMSRSCI